MNLHKAPIYCEVKEVIEVKEFNMNIRICPIHYILF